MRTSHTVAAAALAMMAVSTGMRSLAAQVTGASLPAGERATLMGLVLLSDGSGTPLVGAEVLVPELGLSARTDSAGRYRIDDIPPGTRAVVARHIGFAPLTARLPLEGGMVIERDFELARRPAVALEPVAVKARGARPEFEMRRLLGGGHFITRDELDAQKDKKMAEVLSRVPGLRVWRGAMGHAWAANSRGRSSIYLEYEPDATERRLGAKPGCYPDVYLDGALVFGGKPPLFDINAIGPDRIEGIEYYAGGARVPAKYNRTGAACGVLLIWTRVGGQD